MATIHQTTLVPSKLELLAGWMPVQPWYVGPSAPELHKAGGFRLDDPDGEVGIEFMIVNAIGMDRTIPYLVPMTYRGVPLPSGASTVLIGTTRHGVLGPRWIYDGTTDPLLLTQLNRLLRGETRAQHQSRSDEQADHVLVRRVESHQLADGTCIRRALAAGWVEGSSGVQTVWAEPDGSLTIGQIVSL